MYVCPDQALYLRLSGAYLRNLDDKRRLPASLNVILSLRCLEHARAQVHGVAYDARKRWRSEMPFASHEVQAPFCMA